jgi:hypothetical protein
MSFDFNKSGIWQPKQKNNQLGAMGSGSREQAPGPAPASGPDPLTQAAQGYAINKGTALADAGISKGWTALTQPAATAGTTAATGATTAGTAAATGATAAGTGAALGAGAGTAAATGAAAGTAAAAGGAAATGGMAAAAPAAAAMGPVGLGVLGLYAAHRAGLFNDGTTSVPNAEQLQTHPQSAPLAAPMATPMVMQEAPVMAAPLTQSYVDYRPANFTPADQTAQQDPKMLIQKALGGK